MNIYSSETQQPQISVIDTVYEEQLELKYCYSDEFDKLYAAHQDEFEIELDSLPY